ncbi:CotH kinase family protein [Lysinibacillus fusiformis]|uniref:CotH kinase family protein n=1 Tax=Lysinibacillus fusiformis TaxID=28031 RepID=UPI00088BDC67|nr:CotH kinase family protein [Lysinibacillus fusiformis]SCX60371.1 Spore coat protein CotH [Lysinibacillus fusiformis]SDB39015.1 Spore coat protein CotH [Lysinibacillus fusiformis]SFI48971.1 Spore coat protein CotH [Lysinibacillus fusiformis]SFT04317.1 Spore coat protein CotH [Lysinibacillus fusiformis]
MIKTRIVYLCMAILLLLFVVIYAVLPNVGIETKNTNFSYENIVFNKNKVTTVDIEIAEEDWADMLENAADEELKQADITVNGKKIENVAIRTKGNLTLRSVINSDSDRYSLKIDFDYYDDTQSLYGLKKLNLNNNYSDSTLMREYISYELMEQMGLPTPAHSYMYVTVNGEERGLFLGVEAVDETFLANNYGSNNGFLFKPDGTGSDLKYISDDMTDYTGIGLKTNKDNINQSKFVEMLDAINNGGDIEKYLDIDEMLRYFAVNTALVNLDSYQGNMKHNYYLYEQNGNFSIIPWDYNMSFGGFGAGGGRMGMGREDRQKPVDASNSKSSPMENNGQTDQAGVDRQQQNGQFNMDMGMSGNLMAESAINFSVTTPVSGTTLEERPLLKALLTNEKYRAQYEGYLEELTTNYLTEDYVQSMTKKLAVLLTTYVEADPTKFSTTEQFLEAVEGENSLPEFAKQRSESILKQLSGELVVEASITAQDNTMPVPNEDGEMKGMPDNSDPSQLPEDFDPSQGPTFNKEGNGPMGGEGQNGGPMQRPDENGAPMGMPGANNEIADPAATIDKTTVITIIASFVLLLLSLLFVYRFKRRGR